MTNNNLMEVKDPLTVSEFIFSVAGLWPQQPAPVLFAVYQVYLMGVVISHLYATVDYLNHVMLFTLNLMGCTFNILSAPTMYIIRLNKNIRQITDQIREEIKGEMIYGDMEEKRLYHRYNNISYKFSRYATACQIIMVTLMFFRPLIHLSIHSHKGHGNVTEPYELPFTLHIFVDYKYNARIYVPVYIFATGVTYVAMFHIAEVSFIVTMVLHVCGRFSILSSRIKRLPTKSSHSYRNNIKSIVEEHLNLRKLTRKINESLDMILLCEYISCVVRLALCMYITLLAIRINPVISINFLLFSLDLFAYLYVYSYIGEQLVNETQNVCDAFYSIDWPDVIGKGGRSLLICMINGQKAEYLTAGNIYKFSLFGYMDIVKFTMALVSMLQATMD
ncbi:odorant receptor 2a-like isoform X2 [Augochlora pura]